MTDRYPRQTRLPEIGTEGQRHIESATVCLIGCGALGSGIAEILVRAGIGYLRLVDRDFVELSNLQRQVLYDERDAAERIPKAEAAARKLAAVNSTVRVEPIVTDVTPRNIAELIEGADLVLDGTDNLETRYLINDACVSARIPWVYGGALGMNGMVLPVLPGNSACLRCMLPDPPPPGTLPTCDTAGILSTTARTVGALQATAALQLIVGDESGVGRLTRFDIWSRRFTTADVPKDASCLACGQRKFPFLSAETTAWTTVLCGRNAVQVTPAEQNRLDLAALKQRLATVGAVEDNGFMLTVSVEELDIVLFPDGRAVVQGTVDETRARTLLARLIGA